jgi:hypothetical protein
MLLNKMSMSQTNLVVPGGSEGMERQNPQQHKENCPVVHYFRSTHCIG